MDRIGRILVAADDSESARWAEARATMLSAELKADVLELLTVRERGSRLKVASAAAAGKGAEPVPLQRREIPSLPQRNAGGLACVRSTRVGSAPAVIAERANEMDAGLIIIAARERSFFVDLFARHDHDEIIRRAQRPVLLVRSEPKRPYKSVLVAVDFSDESREAARMALAIAPSAHFIFFHAFGVADESMMRETGVSIDVVNAYRMRAREAARVKLNSFIDELGPRRQLISRSVQYGTPAAAIAIRARQSDVDLIAAGKHGKSRFVEFLLGGVTQRLADQGSCDLLIATSPEECGWDHPPAA